MKMMDKRIMISMPEKLYTSLSEQAKKDYMSIAAYIRKAVMEKMEDDFSAAEQKIIDKARVDSSEGKGVSWRKIKREYS
ncbi:MAG: hypothetical protein KKD05_01920 [Candidatus Omnitrophica bacterium]|nr:hypothetical protein [Candidatus Omnitrophota bacterium]